MNKFIKFLLTAYLSAFIFEEVPRAFFIHILGASQMLHIWQVDNIFTLFFIWYGMIAETFLFKKMNIISFFIFPFLYGAMFYFPFKYLRRN